MAHPHMTFTPARPGTAADTARALAVVHTLGAAISQYNDLDGAEAAGFRARREPESVRPGKLLHVGRRPGSAGEERFDPARPRALLYRREADGRMRLAGAMFVAPLSAGEDDLDAMIPLGVARWHRHGNVCRSGKQKSIRLIRQATTEEACRALGGHFRAESRYMIHVMIDAGDDLAGAFPQRPADDMDMHGD